MAVWRGSFARSWPRERLRPCSPPPCSTGKVGTPMPAQLGTMKVTEQIDGHHDAAQPIRCPMLVVRGAGPG